MTEPLRAPAPRSLTYGECVYELAPELYQIIGQANRDRETLRELSGNLIEDDHE